MKSYRKELFFNIHERTGFVNITPDVSSCLEESGIKEGLALVNSMHITSSVF
ncbi:MAG: YjbQ family protein, partial [Deltaproteobacteria bacterium]|nr:YjbQ family protein [Deltaproteobacteria bacterium]